MSLNGAFGSIIFHMVIDIDETRLQTISQLSAFLAGTLEVVAVEVSCDTLVHIRATAAFLECKPTRCAASLPDRSRSSAVSSSRPPKTPDATAFTGLAPQLRRRSRRCVSAHDLAQFGRQSIDGQFLHSEEAVRGKWSTSTAQWIAATLDP